MKKIAVIICAAGESRRFGGRKKKPFIEVAGRAAFLRSIEFFTDRDDVKQILLAIAPEDEEAVRIKWGPNMSFYGIKICLGGPERFETVANALKLINDDIDLIAVHDSVRCCLQTKWLDDLFAAAAQTGAAMLACPVVATLKKAVNGVITETIDRTGLYEGQTPQVFDAKLLKSAYARLEKLSDAEKSKVSDDSVLIESLGQKVTIVETDNSNIKITKKSDIPIAEAIIKYRPNPKPEDHFGPYSEAQW